MGKIIETQIAIPYLEGNPERTIRIYLPRYYHQRKKENFPVLYMHDGQNLFHNRTSYAGFSWGVKYHFEMAERSGKTDGVIVVGIDNSDLRMYEYASLPFQDFSTDESSSEYMGEAYADFIVNVLKPQVDANLRTLPGPETTWMAGSSAGANITFFTGMRYPEVFSKLGFFSTALWLFDEGMINEYVDESLYEENGEMKEAARALKTYIYTGTEEGGGRYHHLVSQGYLDSAVGLAYGMFGRGMSTDQVRLDIAHGKNHSEQSWRQAFPQFIDFLLED